MYKADALDALVKNYISESGMRKKQILEEILALEDPERRIYAMIFKDKMRAALRVLADACRKRRSREAVKSLVIRDADTLLGIEDDKARKTACILIGLCAPEECAQKLAFALKNEKIRFVRPSIILAIGNTSEPAKYLKGYVIEPGEEKHVREEEEALKKALSKGEAPKKPAGLRLPDKCTLTSLSSKALMLELVAKKCGFSENPDINGAFDVDTKCITGLRCYTDALFYISGIKEYRQASERLDEIGCRGLNYRIEAGRVRQESRRDVIRSVSDGFSAFGYYDNPSAYSFEIRIVGKKLYAVFPDERFCYRKQSVAASINPVAAACIMRICYPFMKKDASVLDPFCGSGTMLIERGYINKTSALVGVDISPAAIRAASVNRKESGLKIALIKGDIFGYGAAKYDEIVTNMPFGIRVSDHSSNLRLYRAFADKLDMLLKDNGAAFLFTQEKNLLRDVINSTKSFNIEGEEDIETGGLCPRLFIIKRKQRNV